MKYEQIDAHQQLIQVKGIIQKINVIIILTVSLKRPYSAYFQVYQYVVPLL